ncbi:MAG: hypothetical protein K1Y36_27745 [Blastocatellia bacterium]|nr:hypothetical protein [Blastocatellia bacterium]
MIQGRNTITCFLHPGSDRRSRAFGSTGGGFSRCLIVPISGGPIQVGLSATAQRTAYQAFKDLDRSAGNLQVLWLEEVLFPVLLARQVFTNEDGSTGIRYLVSSDLTPTAETTQRNHF